MLPQNSHQVHNESVSVGEESCVVFDILHRLCATLSTDSIEISGDRLCTLCLSEECAQKMLQGHMQQNAVESTKLDFALLFCTQQNLSFTRLNAWNQQKIHFPFFSLEAEKHERSISGHVRDLLSENSVVFMHYFTLANFKLMQVYLVRRVLPVFFPFCLLFQSTSNRKKQVS